MRPRAGLLIALAACGSSRGSHMYPAGSDRDDGYGDLAQKSARLLTGDGPDATQIALTRRRHHEDSYGGDAYGGAIYAGDGDPPLAGPVSSAHPHHTPVAGLTGILDGTVTWRGAVPTPLATACGPLGPAVRVAANHAVGGVLVTIDHVQVGRVLPSFARLATVGGTVTKHGCTLAPALQIVTPLPAGFAIHGDATPAQLRITAPTGTRTAQLAPAGRVLFQAQPGVTRVEADDGSLAAAWVVATDTPSYAVTDDDGRFRLDELAPGSYDVSFWRPALPALRDGKLVYGDPVVTHRTIKIDPARPTHLDVALER